jgi:hypothetical protein
MGEVAYGRGYSPHGGPETESMQERFSKKIVTYFLQVGPTSQSFQNFPKECHQLGTKPSMMHLGGTFHIQIKQIDFMFRIAFKTRCGSSRL